MRSYPLLVAGTGSFTDGPKLPRYNLRLPFRIERHRQDRAALVTEELENRDCCPRDVVPGTQRHDNDVACRSAFWALALLVGVLNWSRLPHQCFEALEQKWPPHKGTAKSERQQYQRKCALSSRDAANGDLAGATIFLRVKRDLLAFV